MTKESKAYDNLVGQKVESGDFSLEELTGEKIVEAASENWKDHWKGMPEYEQENKVYQKIVVKFRNKEDLEEFGKLIGQKFTPKTRACWYPAPDGPLESILYRWVEEDTE
jgi:hypothetical protein